MQYKLVREEALEAAKAGFESVTACHVYSLHAGPPTSGEALYLLNHAQDRKLYEKLPGTPNCMLDNRWSSIKCPSAVVRERKSSRAPAKSAAPSLNAGAAKPAASIWVAPG